MVDQDDVVNAYLEPLARMNNGCNHCSSYCFVELPSANSLDASLDLFFEARSARNGKSQSQSAGIRNFQMAPINEKWKTYMEKVSWHWFFNQEYSPKTDKWNAELVVEGFTDILQSVVGEHPRIYKLQGVKDTFDIVVEEMAIESRKGRWMLHFGFSD